ncbi:MAG: M13 family metallopeptidase [Chitinophagaceae bacterium]|nr:M13 family metallopeptidase [Chitinophagaceae bacterium]
MKKLLPSVFLAALSICIFSCNNNESSNSERKSLLLANVDSSVSPGDDFYQFANGKWLDTATIPATESNMGAGKEMYNRTKLRIKEILETVSATSNTAGSIEQKVGDFYLSGMDSAAIEKRGYEPVKPWLQNIDAIKDARAVMQFAAGQITYGGSLLMGGYVGADEKNSSVNIASFYQSGIGLPDRDYYFKTDEATIKTVKAYQNYIQKLFTLTGDDSATAAKNMATIYELEKKIAGSHRTNVELRDPQSNYNKMAVVDLDKKMPAIGWTGFLQAISVKADSLNIGQPGYYQKLNELLTTVPVENWKTYLRFHVLNDAAPALSSPFVQARFDYAGKALSGQQQMKERWERIYQQTDGNLGEALGELYVKKYFTEDAKKRMLDLVNNLQKAFEARITKLDWMSDSTKIKAKEKLYTFIKKIGFPDTWRDYSKVNIDKNKFFENLLACGKNEYNYQVSKIGKPVDRTEWGMSPPTINAYYNPTFNEIVFPAGILQYPFFDADIDDAMNYGAIGMVIGHEMTHGFDDQGAQYDKDGNLKNWWSKEDFEKFKAKGEQVINLYNSFTVLDSLHINGKLTQGENTADIGGIAIAYDAFKLTKQGQDTVKIDGLSPDQRFFLSYAAIWRRKGKDEALRQQINTDPHSPANYRVLGPLMSFTPFYTAFNIKEGDKMFIPVKDRINIW